MLLTLAEAKLGPVGRAAGLCASSQEFIDYLNDATRQLMRRGSWWGTVQPIQGCVYGGCVTWPRYVGSVLAINSGSRYTLPQNRWFSFMNWDDSLLALAARAGCGGSAPISEFDGSAPVFNMIGVPDKLIRFHIDRQADIGKTITLYGIDENGQVLMSTHSDGLYREGLILTLAAPYVTTAIKIRKIDRVLKDVTEGKVRGYQIDDTGIYYDLATYDPSETSPDYVRTKVYYANSASSNQITALVKLAFVPVQNDEDLVLIENQDALRDMVMSIRYKEQGDIARAIALEKTAIRELNYELRDKFPDEQTVINWQPFGTDNLCKVTSGMI